MPSVMERRALGIISRLRQHGHTAYMVGGCVRDRCLGRPVNDIDIATSAPPDQVLALFPRTVPTGLKHGTVTVIVEGTPFEVTTFRQEAAYADYRRPSEVRFVRSLLEDLRRRDFTMNAMALDEHGHLIDPFGGMADLQRGVIRCVGEPDERFSEDALRMLRCIRFAAEYGLEVDDATYGAVVNCGKLLRHVAMERVRAELERMLAGNDPLRGLRLLVESGLFRWFKDGPDWPPARWTESLDYPPLAAIGTLGEHRHRWSVWLMALRCDPDETRSFLRHLTCSNATIRELTAVAACHQAVAEPLAEPVWKRVVLKHGKSAALDWLTIVERTFPPTWELADSGWLGDARRWVDEMAVAAVRDLAVTGNEIKQRLPHVQGKRIGETLNRLVEAAALGQVPNRKHNLLALAAAWNGEGTDEQ